MTVSLFYASSLKLSRHRIISTGGFGRLIMTSDAASNVIPLKISVTQCSSFSTHRLQS